MKTNVPFTFCPCCSGLETQQEIQPEKSHLTIAQENVKREEEGSLHSENKEKQEEREDDEEPKPKLLPARTKVRTWNPSEKVDLAIAESGIEAEEPITVGQLFRRTVEKFPDHPALKYKENGTWKAIPYTEYYNLSIRAAWSFLKVRIKAAW